MHMICNFLLYYICIHTTHWLAEHCIISAHIGHNITAADQILDPGSSSSDQCPRCLKSQPQRKERLIN